MHVKITSKKRAKKEQKKVCFFPARSFSKPRKPLKIRHFFQFVPGFSGNKKSSLPDFGRMPFFPVVDTFFADF